MISIIVPVYNTGRYLRDAIESVLQQEGVEMEVLCVNDGSTDDSLQILEALAKQDRRIVVMSQANQGQSVARNTAMLKARGEYVYFMDSDDVLKPQCLKRCHDEMEHHGYDLLFFDGEVFCEEGTPALGWDYRRTDIYEEGRTYDGPQLMHSLLDNWKHRAVPWLLFIRRSKITKLGLTFYPGIIHEDELFTTLLVLQSHSIGCLKASFVKHRVRANSTMTSHYSRRNVDCYLTVITELTNWAKSHPEHTAIVCKFACYTLDKVFQTAFVLPFKQKLVITKTMIQRGYVGFVTLKTWAKFFLK